MSKHMQLTVTVRPHYESDLEGAFPNLARHLAHLDPDLVRQSPSLYELVGRLDQIQYRFEGTLLRAVLLRHREALRDLRKRIEEGIADWNLALADQLLYRIEDVFGEVESELD